jgi:hypothetical protein
MIKLYLGTDREKARKKMGVDIAKVKGAEIVRITDANTIEDLKASLQSGGMFARKRVLVFENVCANLELCDVLVDSLEALSKSDEKVFIFEEKPLADLRKRLEKYAESVEKFDAPKKERDSSIFAIANALRRADKKALWVSYMREIAKDAGPEAIHGVLFWAAKDMFLKARRAPARRAPTRRRPRVRTRAICAWGTIPPVHLSQGTGGIQ